MKAITLLSGPVGAGKTTVARALGAAASGPVAHIEGDTFWSFLVKGARSRRHKDFRLIMTAMAAAAVPYALADYEVLLDFSIPPWFLGQLRAVAQVKEVPLDYIVLRPSEAICAARAEGTIADYTSYRELYTSFDEVERHIVADDESPAPVVAARIREGLTAGRFRLS